jgi:NAD(P)H-hydrate epimerase
MTRPLSRDEVREVDRRAIAECGMSGLVLMENAGRGCVDLLCQLGCRGPVAVVCGKGNNGGDGFVVARHLDLRAIAVKVLLLASSVELEGDAAANLRILRHCDVPIVDLSVGPGGVFDQSRLTTELAGAEWIVDALLGTGARGAPRSPLDVVIRVLNQHSAHKLAVDLPSGLDCDTGEPAEPTIRAEHTATFVAPKLGFANPYAAEFLGQLHVVDIGAPRRLIEQIAAQ